MVLAAVCTGCRQDKPIPKEDMEGILYDCLLIDRCLDDAYDLRAQADTTLVYIPVIEKYGYTQEKFLSSLRYWLSEPDAFKEIFSAVQEKMKVRLDELVEAENLSLETEDDSQAEDEEKVLEERKEKDRIKLLERRDSLVKAREKNKRDRQNRKDLGLDENKN